MFVDQVTIHCKAGDGGSGCLSFRREANVPRGGPNGGNGGRGGMICVVAARNVSSLSNIAGHVHWRAEPGRNGEGNLKTGRNGKDIEIEVFRFGVFFIDFISPYWFKMNHSTTPDLITIYESAMNGSRFFTL